MAATRAIDGAFHAHLVVVEAASWPPDLHATRSGVAFFSALVFLLDRSVVGVALILVAFGLAIIAMRTDQLAR